MNILIIEDGQYKSERVEEYISNTFNTFKIEVAKSYSSGVKALVEKRPEIAILDMSLPTFDIVNGQGGGDKRMYGGLDIARQIKRRKIESSFIFLTQHKSFSENPQLEKLDDIDKKARQDYGEKYLGCIYYEHAGFEWKDKLWEVLSEFA